MASLCTFFLAAAASTGDRKNVLLLVFDDLRPGLGSYGHPGMITPNIDGLARTSLLFERAFTNYAWGNGFDMS